jgi:hypothetical protein
VITVCSNELVERGLFGNTNDVWMVSMMTPSGYQGGSWDILGYLVYPIAKAMLLGRQPNLKV